MTIHLVGNELQTETAMVVGTLEITNERFRDEIEASLNADGREELEDKLDDIEGENSRLEDDLSSLKESTEKFLTELTALLECETEDEKKEALELIEDFKLFNCD